MSRPISFVLPNLAKPALPSRASPMPTKRKSTLVLNPGLCSGFLLGVDVQLRSLQFR
jgi:hypothetical protein